MPDLFGLDIAGMVNDALSSAGGLVPGSFVKSAPGTRDPDDPTAGTNPTTTIHSFQGFFENLTVTRREGSIVREAGEYVSILGVSIDPATEPEPGIVITLEGRTVTAKELVTRDPAAALFILRVEG